MLFIRAIFHAPEIFKASHIEGIFRANTRGMTTQGTLFMDKFDMQIPIMA